MKAIIYQSSTGHTQRYAQQLAADMGIPAYEVLEARKYLNRGEPVIFMGWIRGRDLMGYGFFVKRYDVRAICVVGAAPSGEQALEKVTRHYHIKNLPLFYLQGGVASGKVRGSDRKILDMLKDDLAKKATRRKKKGLPPCEHEDALLGVLVRGGDYVCQENLSEIMDWVETQTENSHC